MGVLLYFALRGLSFMVAGLLALAAAVVVASVYVTILLVTGRRVAGQARVAALGRGSGCG